MNSRPQSCRRSRRSFLGQLLTVAATIITYKLPALARQPGPEPASENAVDSVEFKGKTVFYRLVSKAIANNWQNLPIGELIGKIAHELEGTPYIASTLEIYPNREVCSVNLLGLDCVTFIETTLALARMLKKGGGKPEDLLSEIAMIRYRGGTAGDYSTRLHYMSDWLSDNTKKGIVKPLDQLPGAVAFTQKVGFMSAHPASYRRLIGQPEQVEKIKKCEEAINSRSLKFVPLNKIAAVEPLLKTGDIVAVCTNQAGLDVVHTGFVYRTADGIAHFIDASSAKSKMRVTLESGPISGSLHWSKNLIGVMLARPLEL